jgi:hypothetical protein
MLVVFDDPGDKKTGGVIAAPVLYEYSGKDSTLSWAWGQRYFKPESKKRLSRDAKKWIIQQCQIYQE